MTVAPVPVIRQPPRLLPCSTAKCRASFSSPARVMSPIPRSAIILRRNSAPIPTWSSRRALIRQECLKGRRREIRRSIVARCEKNSGSLFPMCWKHFRRFSALRKASLARAQLPGAKLIALDDLSEVADGVYYSRYPLPLVDAEVIAFLKQAATKSPLRRARFCAHLSPDAEQHDMLIVSHRDTYVTPHRHLNKSETFVTS